jgi:hypothetical protein
VTTISDETRRSLGIGPDGIIPDEHLAKARACTELLPYPGNEVSVALLAHIDAVKQRLDKKTRDIIRSCGSSVNAEADIVRKLMGLPHVWMRKMENGGWRMFDDNTWQEYERERAAGKEGANG